MTHSFEEVSDVHQLLQCVRRRFQMWVGDDICELKGFLMGFCCARGNMNAGPLWDFDRFVKKSLGPAKEAEGWSSLIARRAKHPMAAIPKFFSLYEKFSGTKSTEIKRINLNDQEKKAFLAKGYHGFARGNLPAPDVVSMRDSECWGVHLVYERDTFDPLYELSVASAEAANALLAKYATVGE